MTKMFPFITIPNFNPIAGKCPHNCIYCWTPPVISKFKLEKYVGEPCLVEKELQRHFRKDEFVFVEDMSDGLAENVPKEMIAKIRDFCGRQQATFLFLTKNPRRYHETQFPSNCILGATIESNRNYPVLSYAPPQTDRIFAMLGLVGRINRTFVSVEPILEFDLSEFVENLKELHLWAVAVGYDNYSHHLPEPKLGKTLALISILEKSGITVYRKTLRKAWNE